MALLGFCLLAACSVTGPPSGSPADDTLPRGDQGGVKKIGNPYKVAGVWYTPKEEPDYDQVGLASWYGKQFHGKKTANGEVFNMNAITAAHKTLPLPSFVKVTNLENGRAITVRVNDRGPFVGDRIIDLSRRSAQLLGFEQQGVARVRVQLLDARGRPASRQSRSTQATQKPSAENSASGASDTGVAAEAAGTLPKVSFVQIGAYRSNEAARQQQAALDRAGFRSILQQVQTEAGALWRIRLGPYQTRREAEAALDRVIEAGFYEARIFSN